MIDKILTAISSRWSTLLHQYTLIEEFKKEVALLPALQMDQSAANNEWTMNRMKIRSLILNKNPRSFLNWDIIRYTMFVGKQSYVANELGHLKRSVYWRKRYEQAIIETNIGRPERSIYYKKSSSNLIHNAFTLCQFEEQSQTTVDDLNVVLEFGGGYGSMCRLFHNLRFRGKYIIFDFPEFNALQKFYLKSIGLPVLNSEDVSKSSSGIVCLSDMEHLTRVIPVNSKKLFLATWSISETSEYFRRFFFEAIPEFDHYLIAYQQKFGEVDNTAFFSTFIKNREALSWKAWEIPHLKDQYYLIGATKKK